MVKRLDLDSLISSNSWATLEELENVVPFHLGRFNEVIKKYKINKVIREEMQTFSIA